MSHVNERAEAFPERIVKNIFKKCSGNKRCAELAYILWYTIERAYQYRLKKGMTGMKHTHYLLLIEAYACHDCDEWLGIYHDDETLKEAYEEASALMAQDTDEYSEAYQVAIYEFLPVEEGPQITYTYYIKSGQRIRKRTPEDLACFKGGEKL